jgi:hypothetical protein
VLLVQSLDYGRLCIVDAALDTHPVLYPIALCSLYYEQIRVAYLSLVCPVFCGAHIYHNQ